MEHLLLGHLGIFHYLCGKVLSSFRLTFCRRQGSPEKDCFLLNWVCLDLNINDGNNQNNPTTNRNMVPKSVLWDLPLIKNSKNHQFLSHSNLKECLYNNIK